MSQAWSIGEFREEYLAAWWAAGAEMPAPGDLRTRKQQKEKGRELDGFIAGLTAAGKSASAGDGAARLEKAKTAARLFLSKNLAESGLRQSDNILDGFGGVMDAFVAKARAFDPDLRREDIHQALRNVWIANSLQVFWGMPVSLTPSIFAYSMLYPYTDNYLDRAEVSIGDKLALSRWFRRRLAGETYETHGQSEKVLGKLVAMIEAEHPRGEAPEVYRALLGIHDAQTNALLQHGPGRAPYEIDLMGISVEKGGTSVMADACLLKGKLTAAEARLAFGYGVALQLIDDLQDLREDLRRGQQTVFNLAAGKWPLDNLTNKLFAFIDAVLGEMPFPGREGSDLRALVRQSCRMLVLEAVARQGRLYSRGYLRRIETQSPLRLADLGGLQSRLQRKMRGWV